MSMQKAPPGSRSRAGKRMGATIYEINSSHVPMLSNPGLVIDVIRTAANAVQRSMVGA
jgi:hypothetical protein